MHRGITMERQIPPGFVVFANATFSAARTANVVTVSLQEPLWLPLGARQQKDD